MSAPATDERLHRDVIEPLLRAALGKEPGGVIERVYDYGMVPGEGDNAGSLPNIFVLLSFERRYVEPRHAGRATRSGWRLACRYVGRTVNEARWAAEKCTGVIESVCLPIGGETTTPITHESTQAIEPDDGRFSGLTLWTYAL